MQPLCSGSSPRGRGTPACALPGSSRARFIPARAGNTPGRETPSRSPAVHPRAGGEHPPLALFSARCTGSSRAGGEHRGRQADRYSSDGSSPRGRGTPSRCGRDAPGWRFIPARAGNTTTCSAAHRRTTVHPRAGRGTPRRRQTRHDTRRFIPARAGNTRKPPCPRGCGPVHPRAGGEHA